MAPPDVVTADFDPVSPDFIACPFPMYERLRAEAPIAWVPHGKGFWLVTRYDLVVRVARDFETFSSELGDLTTAPPSPELREKIREILAGDVARVATLLTLDPPAHTRNRRLVAPAFTPRSVQVFEPVVRALIADLLDGWRDGEPVEFVSRFAIPLPVGAIAHGLAVPPERADDLKRWSDAAVATIGSDLSDEQRLEVARQSKELHRFLLEQITARRHAPGDDLISQLVRARLADDELDDLGAATERNLTDAEIVSILRQLLVAGNETTTNLLTQAMVLFAQNPAWWERMRADPSVIPSVVEECLRLTAPSAINQRIATRDVEIEGVTIRRGDRVLVSYLSANRDAEVFAAPDRFEPGRHDASKHLAFGTGVHLCIGAPLARLEIRLAFDELSRRIESFELVVEEPFAWNSSFVLRAITALMIRPRMARDR